MTYEQALKQLEQIVAEIESGDLPLEKAFERFEEGMRLSKFCTEKLDQTEQKVTQLIQSGSGISKVPFTIGTD